MKTERVKTSALVSGNVVREHGMRILLEGERHNLGSHSGNGEAWLWSGRVLNIDEVRRAGFVPLAYLQTFKWDRTDGWVLDREDHWTVQGNDLATWTVERP